MSNNLTTCLRCFLFFLVFEAGKRTRHLHHGPGPNDQAEACVKCLTSGVFERQAAK